MSLDYYSPDVKAFKAKATERRVLPRDARGPNFAGPSVWTGRGGMGPTQRNPNTDTDSTVVNYKTTMRTINGYQTRMSGPGRMHFRSNWGPTIFNEYTPLATGTNPNVEYSGMFNIPPSTSGIQPFPTLSYDALWEYEGELDALTAIDIFERVSNGSGTTEEQYLVNDMNLGNAVIHHASYDTCNVESIADVNGDGIYDGICGIPSNKLSSLKAKLGGTVSNASGSCAADIDGLKAPMIGLVSGLPISLNETEAINRTVQASEFVPVKITISEGDKYSRPIYRTGWASMLSKNTSLPEAGTHPYNQSIDIGCGMEITSPFESHEPDSSRETTNPPWGYKGKAIPGQFDTRQKGTKLLNGIRKGTLDRLNETEKGMGPYYQSTGMGLRYDKRVTLVMGPAVFGSRAFTGGQGAIQDQNVAVDNYLNSTDYRVSTRRGFGGLRHDQVPLLAILEMEIRYTIPPGWDVMPIASIVTMPKGNVPARQIMKSRKVQPFSIQYIPSSEYRIGTAKITVTELLGGYGSHGTNDIVINHRLAKHIRAIRYTQWIEPQADGRALICADPNTLQCQLYGPPQS